jgi:hypothetical protein
MKAKMAGVMAAALVGLATTAVMVTQAGERAPVTNGSSSVNTPVVDVAGTFRQLDRDGSGSLSLAEFTQIYRVIGRLQVNEAGLPNGAGPVTALGMFPDEQTMAYLFAQLDANHDGMLSPAEFALINEMLAVTTQY